VLNEAKAMQERSFLITKQPRENASTHRSQGPKVKKRANLRIRNLDYSTHIKESDETPISHKSRQNSSRSHSIGAKLLQLKKEKKPKKKKLPKSKERETETRILKKEEMDERQKKELFYRQEYKDAQSQLLKAK